MFKTWREGGPVLEIGALDVKCAAQIYALYEALDITSWPVVVNVTDPKNRRWSVLVHRVMVPEYKAEEPVRAKT